MEKTNASYDSVTWDNEKKEKKEVSSSSSNSVSAESERALAEGISLTLSRWTALQMAIHNEWGGRDSHRKSLQLASDLLNWFTLSKGPLYIDDLENMLDENMVLSFNTELQDGSIEEIAEQLMIMHEECLRGNYESVEKLRNSNVGAHAVNRCIQVKNEEDESSEDESSGMILDEPEARPNPIASAESKPSELEPRASDNVHGASKSSEPMDAEEGWSVVTTRRNRGKRC